MSENIIITMAVGSLDFGNLALNLALSVKAQKPNQKIALIHTLSAVKGIEPLCEAFFDYHYIVHNEEGMENHSYAFYLKTKLYDIATEIAPDANAYLFIDADCIILPKDKNSTSNYIDEWFEKHKDRNFTAYCNDIFDYKTGMRKRKDYTFWCDVLEIKEWFGDGDKIVAGFLNAIPQINSSFLYFKRHEFIKMYFDDVKKIYELATSDKIKYQPYKSAIPDELCFNIASAATEIMPHQNPYRPIFFQFASEQNSIPYILQHFKAMGFAGTQKPVHHLLDFYNQLSIWYRQLFGVSVPFIVQQERWMLKDDAVIEIKPLQRRTIYRRGELPNSDAGVFNPSAIQLSNGNFLTVMRKQPNMECYMGVGSNHSSIAHVINGNEEYELNPVGYDNERLEDFRLFMCGKAILCNHNIIIKDTRHEREFTVCLAYVDGGDLCKIGTPKLPIEITPQEKNWAFFGEGNRMWCIYSLKPYRIFYADAEDGWQKWTELEVEQPNLDWWHRHALICNSTNPILVFDQYYLMFYHSKMESQYFHGALLIDKETKNIAHYMRHSFNVETVGEGLHKGLVYISGAVLIEREGQLPILRVFAGDSDSHSVFMDYEANEFCNAIIDSK